MRICSSLVNMPVVDRVGGRVVGRVKYADCRPGEQHCRGIIYQTQGLQRRLMSLPMNAIAILGNHSIIADTSRAVRAQARGSQDSRMRLFDSGGEYIGRISNFLIDERTAQITALELSRSLGDDLEFGRKIIRNKGNIIPSQGCSILVEEDSTNGGGKGGFQ